MSKKRDSGPAPERPRELPFAERTIMTNRDMMALSALEGLLAAGGNSRYPRDTLAARAYRIADAMIAARDS